MPRMRLTKQFNGRREGHVKDYPLGVAASMLDGGYAVETDEDESPDELMSWDQDRPGEAAVKAIEETEAENADLRDQIAALQEQMKKKPGRPKKVADDESEVTE